MWGILFLLATNFVIPITTHLPVKNMDRNSYSRNSFWFYPWGKSVTHKGVDVFATKGTPILSATEGLVIKVGNTPIGGNVVMILDRQLKIHYYAHLQSIITSKLNFVKAGTPIGTVGNTGNAQGKSPHLHYAIMLLIPRPWRCDTAIQGYKKMFYLNPIDYF